MVKCPKIGVKYFTTDEWWGNRCVVPVTVTELNSDYGEDGEVWRGYWMLGEYYQEEYDFLQPKDLYLTEDEAWEAIRREQEKEAAQ